MKKNNIMELSKYSNYEIAQAKTNLYFGKPTKLHISNRKDKKYYVIDDQNKKHYFGQMGYEDYTKHQDDDRRYKYLARATKIKGDWKNNKYSPNNLSINILW